MVSPYGVLPKKKDKMGKNVTVTRDSLEDHSVGAQWRLNVDPVRSSMSEICK